MQKRATFVLVILMCAALAALVFWPRYLVLDVARADSRSSLLCAKMYAGEEVVLTFVHSVNRRPVYDTIRVASDHLVVVKSVFDSFGAGMPEASTEEGTLRVGKDGWLEWTINRPMPEVVVRIGWVANHTLRWKDRQVALADLAPPGTAVALRPKAYSWFDLWKGRCIR
jgi:hypothetical protein